MPALAPVDLGKAIDYNSLKGRNVLLTGGASGLGAAFARMFTKHGANLVIADLNEAGGKKLEQELGSSATYVIRLHALDSLTNDQGQIHSNRYLVV